VLFVNKTSLIVIVFGTIMLLSGCSTPERFNGITIGETPTLITSVPPLLQTKKISCGPTCVAAVAAYWGKDYSPVITRESPYFAEDFSAMDLTNLVGRLDLKSFIYSGSVADLEDHVRNGRPVIVLIPRPRYQHDPELMFNGLSMEQVWDAVAPKYSHWVIVIGFTPTKIILQDPAAGRMMVTRAKFDGWWKAKRRTCLVATP
jgi:predicted double-glycine peptidase